MSDSGVDKCPMCGEKIDGWSMSRDGETRKEAQRRVNVAVAHGGDGKCRMDSFPLEAHPAFDSYRRLAEQERERGDRLVGEVYELTARLEQAELHGLREATAGDTRANQFDYIQELKSRLEQARRDTAKEICERLREEERTAWPYNSPADFIEREFCDESR